MQCMTIQNEKVLKMLIDNGEYYTDKKPMAGKILLSLMNSQKRFMGLSIRQFS